MPHRHVALEQYDVGLSKWEAWIDPDPPTYHRSATQEAFNIINAALPEAAGWSFFSSGSELSENSLIVHEYEAAYEENCLDDPMLLKCVGANFGIEYRPVKGVDPEVNVHWLQVAFSNHALNPSEHGRAEEQIDQVDPGNVYYDNGGTANSRVLQDTPCRADVGRDHKWRALLILVQGPEIPANGVVPPGKVIMLGALEWGWRNACEGTRKDGSFTENADTNTCAVTGVPEVSALALALPGLLVLLLGKRILR